MKLFSALTAHMHFGRPVAPAPTTDAQSNVTLLPQIKTSDAKERCTLRGLAVTQVLAFCLVPINPFAFCWTLRSIRRTRDLLIVEETLQAQERSSNGRLWRAHNLFRWYQIVVRMHEAQIALLICWGVGVFLAFTASIALLGVERYLVARDKPFSKVTFAHAELVVWIYSIAQLMALIVVIVPLVILTEKMREFARMVRPIVVGSHAMVTANARETAREVGRDALEIDAMLERRNHNDGFYAIDATALASLWNSCNELERITLERFLRIFSRFEGRAPQAPAIPQGVPVPMATHAAIELPLAATSAMPMGRASASAASPASAALPAPSAVPVRVGVDASMESVNLGMRDLIWTYEIGFKDALAMATVFNGTIPVSDALNRHRECAARCVASRRFHAESADARTAATIASPHYQCLAEGLRQMAWRGALNLTETLQQYCGGEVQPQRSHDMVRLLHDIVTDGVADNDADLHI
jgi:hypothetical protein